MGGLDTPLPYLDALDGGDVVRKRTVDGQRPRTFINRKAGLRRQQIVLKYLVSTADLKYRPPYGKAYTSNRRYASFIGTTNEQMPLTDPTGSRRFVCVGIDGDIDFLTPVQHDQLYAQLVQEIRQGERYWLTKEEERSLMEHNLQYQRLNGLPAPQRSWRDADGRCAETSQR